MFEDVNISGSSQRPHYIFIIENLQKFFGLNDWLNTYNIRALEYDPTHNALITDLENLWNKVDITRKDRLSL